MRSILVVLIALQTSIAFTQNKKKAIENDSIEKLNPVIVNVQSMFGSKYAAKNRTGSAYYISPEELNKNNYTNINRTLQSVPGVTFYEEDGFGLRPNISLRGTSPQRSAKISLMEDGVLIAPAPYSSPSAYYFPSVGRMDAVEILKGSSQVQYGPFTTGGAINMVSAKIPDTLSGKILANYGAFNTRQIHARIGSSFGQIGYVAEVLNYGSGGFKNLPDGSHTGFDMMEVLTKLRYSSKPRNNTKHYLEAKFLFSDEVSNETYLGLTESDFKISHFDRYAASQDDQMIARNIQYLLTDELHFNKYFKMISNAYYNQFARNWYKLDDVVFNGDSQPIANVITNPLTYPDHLNIIRGSFDTTNDAVLLKANNRTYYATGIQTKLDYHWSSKNIYHDIEFGARYHYDQEDRYQWEDGYSMINQQLNKTSERTRGAEGNRISSAQTFAAYTLYKLKWNNLTLTPGLRYENMSLGREDYGANDPYRAGTHLSVRKNHIAIFIPGIGFNYNLTKNMSAFGGAHKGFSPPGSTIGEKSEESINYELGTRFGINKLKGEIVGFYNDYHNLLGSDLAATGGSGSLDQFNAGEVAVKGIELLLNYDLIKTDKFSIPLAFTYTFTDSKFLNSFDSSNDLWGDVAAGDELPYIPKHQCNISLSFEHIKFELNLNGRYNGEFRTLAGNGRIPDSERVDSNFIIDFSGKYHLNKKLSLTTNIINLLNETYAVSTVPAGLRPGHPFGASAGMVYNFK